MISWFQEGKIAQWTRWTIVGVATLAWIFSIVVVADCRFIRHEYAGYYSYWSVAVGIFRNQDDDGWCDDSSSNSGARKGARFCGVMTVLLLSASMIILLLVQLLRQSVDKYAEKLWWTIRVLFILALPFQAGTFAVYSFFKETYYDPGETYWMGPDGVLASINILLLLLLIALSWAVAPRDTGSMNERPASDKRDVPEAAIERCEKQVTVTVKEELEGTTTIEEVIEADGTKTITETFKPSNVAPTVTVKEEPEGTTTIEQVIEADGTKTITETFKPSNVAP